MPPLYFLANKWIYGFFAPGEIGLRVLSAAGSVLAGCLLFAAGRTLFSAEVGLWGLLLFAVNSTQIVYAQNARPYAIGLMLSAASMLCFLKWKVSFLGLGTGYVVRPLCCFHVHYIFSILLVNGSTCCWSMLASGTPANAPRWKAWLALQVCHLLLPLYRNCGGSFMPNSLNWEKYPEARICWSS
jgi:hypothetical protein